MEHSGPGGGPIKSEGGRGSSETFEHCANSLRFLHGPLVAARVQRFMPEPHTLHFLRGREPPGDWARPTRKQGDIIIMALQFETTESGGRKAKQKSFNNGVLAELEIPNGTNPQQNAWLTLTLGYGLTFMDRNTPASGGTDPNERILIYSGSAWYARDTSGYMFPVLDWTMSAIELFHKKFRQAEDIWNQKFQIITPPDYAELHYRSGADTIRPNVLCLFRMASGARNSQNFNVVRLDPSVTEVWHENGKTSKPFNYPFGFRSNEGTLADCDWRTETLGHELGHALGLEHILALKGDAQCKLDQNAKRCYGVTLEELRNIMGAGRDITLLNSGPWRDQMGQITRQNMGKWSMVLMTDPNGSPLPPTKLSGKAKKK